jgi:hypothetical protein
MLSTCGARRGRRPRSLRRGRGVAHHRPHLDPFIKRLPRPYRARTTGKPQPRASALRTRRR